MQLDTQLSSEPSWTIHEEYDCVHGLPSIFYLSYQAKFTNEKIRNIAKKETKKKKGSKSKSKKENDNVKRETIECFYLK